MSCFEETPLSPELASRYREIRLKCSELEVLLHQASGSYDPKTTALLKLTEFLFWTREALSTEQAFQNFQNALKRQDKEQAPPR